MNATQTRKPRSKPERRIRMIEGPAVNDPDGYFAVEILAGKRADTYVCHAIPDGYEVEKLDARLAPVETYVVTLDADAASCTCKGHERHRHCKHVDGLEALRRVRKLPCYRSGGDYAANDPIGFDEHMRSLTADEYSDEDICPV